MIPIMRDFSDPRYTDVVAVMGAQMGKTDTMLNVMGHRLDDDPVPMLYIGPTQKLVESFSSDRFAKMIASAPTIEAKLAKGKKNKITEKVFGGVRVGFGWAGSATELASHPAAIVLLDERDRMGGDVGGEGDPVELGRARVSNYADGKVGIFSTPTLGNLETEIDEASGLERWKVPEQTDDGPASITSPIWQLWQQGTRYEWAWPCPDCSEYFIPRFRLLKWPEHATPYQALKEARLCCPHCGSMISDGHKHRMNARAHFVAPGQRIAPDGTVTGEPPQSPIVSRWVSGLCSPWQTFGQRARAFLEAVRSGNQKRVQAVLNTRFGELYSVAGEAPDWQIVAALRLAYAQREVPEGVRVLTCSVDVQKNRLVYSVRGWGVGLESWLIEHGELWGETEHDEVWGHLAELLDNTYGDLSIRMMLVDSGYRPGSKWRRPDNQIYAFCRRFRGRAYPTKGHEHLDKPAHSSRIDITLRGVTIKGGLNLWHIDSDFFKSWTHARIEWPANQPGGWHLPADATDDYCQQIVSEARVVKPSGHVTWVRVRRENHYLDCEALNAAAAHILKLQVALQPLKPKTEEPKPPDEPMTAQRAVQMQRRKQSFVMGWRPR